jgi:aspartate carbamoyltransferase catalytic subunit
MILVQDIEKRKKKKKPGESIELEKAFVLLLFIFFEESRRVSQGFAVGRPYLSERLVALKESA